MFKNQSGLPAGQAGIAHILILLAVVGLLAFLIISNTFGFKDKLFNVLFPKPPSKASVGISNPTKLTPVYGIPKYLSTGQELSVQEMVNKFNLMIDAPTKLKIQEIRVAGFNGPILQYILATEMAGPLGMDSLSAQSTTCTSTQKSYYPEWPNNITMYQGSFCQIHDSIVNKTAFDHDLNSATPNIVATEDWFLHRKDNSYRVVQNQSGMPNGVFYLANPANQQWKDYFTSRVLREMQAQIGDPISPWYTHRSKMDGVFLDNVPLSWNKVLRYNGYPKEFSLSADYANAAFGFTQQVFAALHGSGNSYPLYANLIEGNDNGSEWDRYSPYLDGAMHEGFALNWGNGPHPAQVLQNQLLQAEKWIQSGKSYIAIGQGKYGSSSNDSWAKYSLAAYLLVTDGVKGYFNFDGAFTFAEYDYFYEYPEYYYQLGAPTAPKYKVSDNPLVYKRDFQCGWVELNITNAVGTITQTSNNCSAATPTPTPVSGQTVKIYAAGTVGNDGNYPNVELKIDDKIVQTFTNVKGNPSTRTFQELTYNHPSAVSTSQIKVGFINDDGPRDLLVDRINVGGADYQTESSTTYTITFSSGCPSGYTGYEWLWCNGYFAYNHQQNPSPTPTPIPTPTPKPPAETIPPTVSVTYPVNGATVPRNTNFTITANASDNIAVAKVEFLINGGIKCTDTASPYSCSAKIGGKRESSHTITAKAYDTSNNSASSSITVIAK